MPTSIALPATGQFPVADPLGDSTTYSYDANGNVTSKTDENGATTTYSYDSLGRLVKKGYPDGTAASFTYDAKGNVVTATNQNISYAFSYDGKGEVTSVTDSNGRTIGYTYDAAGNKTKMVGPDGKAVTYGYDTAGRLTTIMDGGAFQIGYDNLGRRSSLRYPNGDTTSYSYDSNGRLAGIVQRNANGGVITSNSYSLDKVGNRLSNATLDRRVSYSYDNIYRLAQALSSASGSSSNTKGKGGGIAKASQQQREFDVYDPVGNRVASDKAQSYTYNEGNELVSNGGTYTYDKNGNLIRKATSEGTTTYAWDYENRLIRVTMPDGSVTAFAYDPFGRRIAKKVSDDSGDTADTHYFYDNDTVLFEYDDTGVIGNRYTHGPGVDEHFAVTTGKDRYYYHADGLGSVMAVTDSGGKVVQTYDYDSFGNLKDQKNRVKQPYAYTGREWDKETGLYYYRARYYDPMEGRFVSKDPIGFAGGINLYSYVQSNPLNFIDPTGLEPVTDKIKQMDTAGLEAPNPFLDPVNYVGGFGGALNSLGTKTAEICAKSTVNQGTNAILRDGFYEVNGVKFSAYYFNKLWDTGRGGVSLVAREILDNGTKGVPDAVKAGFFRYERFGWEMVYNPSQKRCGTSCR